MSARLFDSGDREYQDWMYTNSTGWVANTRRSSDSRIFTIHRARCFHITKYGPPRQAEGCFTTGDSVKVCSLEAGELEVWRSQHRPLATPTICGSCKRNTLVPPGVNDS
jgi:hypothetical protein